MRRFALITLLCMMIPIAILFAYLMVDKNQNIIPPIVETPTYSSMFEDAVRKKTGGKLYSNLNEIEKQTVLVSFINMQGNDPVKEVALSKINDLTDKEFALKILKPVINKLDPNLYEVAVSSVNSFGTFNSKKYLDSLWNTVFADPASITPLAGYTQSQIIVSPKDKGLEFNFNEQSRNKADYANSKTNEMTLLFPKNPDYFLAIPNFDDVLQNFKSSGFSNQIGNSSAKEDIWEYPVFKSIKTLRDRINKAFGPASSLFTLEELFRDNLLLANYSNDILIATYKDKNLEFAENVIKAFEKIGKNFGIKRYTIGDAQISSIESRIGGKPLCFGSIKDYFIVGTSISIVENSVQTFQTNKSNSLGIDPTFKYCYSNLDPTGVKDVLFYWFNPTDYFKVIGSRSQMAVRLNILARILNRTTDLPAKYSLQGVNNDLISLNFNNQSPNDLWRYIVGERALNSRFIDSLKQVTNVNFETEILPYLTSSSCLSYEGVNYLNWTDNYDATNSAYNVTLSIPLSPSTPKKFYGTLAKFIGSLSYGQLIDKSNGDLIEWVYSDTSKTYQKQDSLLIHMMLTPCFAVKNNILMISTNPQLLDKTVNNIKLNQTQLSTNTFLTGKVFIPKFVANSKEFLSRYFEINNSYTKKEIKEHIDPLCNALNLFNALEIEFKNNNGLKQGHGRLF